MRATVDAKSFSEALKNLSMVLQKSSVPILENIHVEMTGRECLLIATNMETWMSARIPAEGNEFSFTFQNTVNVARACRYYEGCLILELTGEIERPHLVMRCGDKSGEFPVDTAQRFSDLPMESADQQYRANAKVLYRRARCVQYASIKNIAKPALAGARFEGNRVWCTDGRRAAISYDNALQVQKPFVVPTGSLAYLRVFGDADMDIRIGQRYASFLAGMYTIQCRLLESEAFYNLDVAWPKKCNEQYCVDRKHYLEAIKYLSEFAGKSKTTAIFDRGKISLNGSDFTFTAEVPIDGQCDIIYGFDLQYMREALEQLAESDTIQIGASSWFSPITLTGNQGDSAMVLPVRIKEELRSRAA